MVGDVLLRIHGKSNFACANSRVTRVPRSCSPTAVPAAASPIFVPSIYRILTLHIDRTKELTCFLRGKPKSSMSTYIERRHPQWRAVEEINTVNRRFLRLRSTESFAYFEFEDIEYVTDLALRPLLDGTKSRVCSRSHILHF